MDIYQVLPALLAFFLSTVAVSQSSPVNTNTVCSTNPALPPDLDTLLAQKLSDVSDKSTIPDVNTADLIVNQQTTHLPCPKSLTDPDRWNSPSDNIKNIIPW